MFGRTNRVQTRSRTKQQKNDEENITEDESSDNNDDQFNIDRNMKTATSSDLKYILFATECQFERKSMDSCHFDLTCFLQELEEEFARSSQMKPIVSHKIKNNYFEDSMSENDEYNPRKHSKYEQVESNIGRCEDIFFTENRYTNIYIQNSFISSSKKLYETIRDSNTVKNYLNESCLNVKEYPLAKNYLMNKVIGKFNHMPYELVDWRKKTPVLLECINDLEHDFDFKYFEGDKSFLYENSFFWVWYHSCALIEDKANFNRKIDNDQFQTLAFKRNLQKDYLNDDLKKRIDKKKRQKKKNQNFQE